MSDGLKEQLQDVDSVDTNVEGLVKIPSDVIPDKHRKFAGLLVEELDEDLRLIFYFDQDGSELCFLRYDMYTKDLLPRVSELREMVLDDLTFQDTELADTYGQFQSCVLNCEETAILCFLEQKKDRGLIATTDQLEGLINVPR